MPDRLHDRASGLPAEPNSQVELLNRDLSRSDILSEAAWSDGHGARDAEGYLGTGALYYSIAYSLKAQLCVCLGSGGGFVPRLMRQAQRDLKLEPSRTILVDGDMGDYGRPVWTKPGSAFRTKYPEIEIVKSTTLAYSQSLDIQHHRIDYLHIDADHSHEGALADFENYKSFMSPYGLITFHDTTPIYSSVTCWKALDDIRMQGHAVINIPWVGAGVAMIQLKTAVGQTPWVFLERQSSDAP